MNDGRLFSKALNRPKNYNRLSEREQWAIDSSLGILDWSGACPHSSKLCDCCKEIYLKRD